MLMPDLTDNDDGLKESVIFTYFYDGTLVTKSIENYAVDLNMIADAMTDFLKRAGYDYVVGVTIHKDNGGSAGFNDFGLIDKELEDYKPNPHLVLEGGQYVLKF